MSTSRAVTEAVRTADSLNGNLELRGSSLINVEENTQWVFDSSEIELGGQLGAGTYGTVYRASLRGKAVAVKKLNVQHLTADMLDEFKMEVAIMAKLRHPNVILFMGAVVEPDQLMIVTELMQHGSLHSLIHDPQRSKAISFAQRMKMAKDTALGMNWLHLSKPCFIHRDLKPANLLVNDDFGVKVCDFGISLAKNAGESFKFGSIGTPVYMAPELLQNQEYDESVDVYSYGILLNELITGQEPFEDISSVEDLVTAVVVEKRRPAIPTTCSPSLKNLIETCWSSDPFSRPKFAQILELLDEATLEGIIADAAGVQFWRKNFATAERVNTNIFTRKLLLHCKVKPDGDGSATQLCLSDLIGRDGAVTPQSFHDWLQTFGPLRSDAAIINSMIDLLRQPWFHGDVATAEAERLLLARGTEGVFLVRFSSQPGSYTVSCLRAGRVMHYRATRQASNLVIGNVTVQSVADLVSRCRQQLGLAEPLPGSKYQKFFSASADSQGAAYFNDIPSAIAETLTEAQSYSVQL